MPSIASLLICLLLASCAEHRAARQILIGLRVPELRKTPISPKAKARAEFRPVHPLVRAASDEDQAAQILKQIAIEK